jgi:hypothetical protein
LKRQGGREAKDMREKGGLVVLDSEAYLNNADELNVFIPSSFFVWNSSLSLTALASRLCAEEPSATDVSLGSGQDETHQV